jgi:hypothetical protein
MPRTKRQRHPSPPVASTAPSWGMAWSLATGTLGYALVTGVWAQPRSAAVSMSNQEWGCRTSVRLRPLGATSEGHAEDTLLWQARAMSPAVRFRLDRQFALAQANSSHSLSSAGNDGCTPSQRQRLPTVNQPATRSVERIGRPRRRTLVGKPCVAARHARGPRRSARGRLGCGAEVSTGDGGERLTQARSIGSRVRRGSCSSCHRRECVAV